MGVATGYIDFLILLIPSPLFLAVASLLFSFLKMFFRTCSSTFFNYILCIK